MEQLRQEYENFTQLNSEVVVIAPDTMGNAQSFFSRSPVPFTALVDNSLEVYEKFDVQKKLVSLGQRPGLFIIDKQGIVQFAYIGSQQWEIPSNQVVLDKLMELEKRTVYRAEGSTQSRRSLPDPGSQKLSNKHKYQP